MPFRSAVRRRAFWGMTTDQVSNEHENDDGMVIFTSNSEAARCLAHQVERGMIGVTTISTRWPNGIKAGATVFIPTMN